MASITTEQAKIVSSLSRGQGRKKLLVFLGWRSFDEDDDMRQSILLDYHYDTLMFSVKKGFPWNQVCAAVKMTSQVQQQSRGVSLPEAIKIYRQTALEYGSIFGEVNIKIITDYFFSTYMKHYKLYQYVLTKEREGQNPKQELDINLCVPPEKLSSATPISVWEYQEKIKEIECKETQREAATEERQQKQKETIDDLVEKSVDDSDPEKQVDREEFLKIMKEVLDIHISSVGAELRNIIDDTRDDMECKLEKVALPRPIELGQPPRYATKTPILISKEKSKDKLRSSAKSADKRAK